MARVWELVLNYAIAVLYLWFFTVSRYGAMPNELLILLYVLDIGYILAFCIFVAHSVLNWSVSTFLHSDRKFDGIFATSISYSVTSSLTRVTHVVKLTECNLVSSSYTFFTIVLAGIWCRRLIKLNTDIVHWTLGGNIPHSPCTMMLLVVALTFSMRLQYLNMTLSIDSRPTLQCLQTSLPYTNMGYDHIHITSSSWRKMVIRDILNNITFQFRHGSLVVEQLSDASIRFRFLDCRSDYRPYQHVAVQ